MKDQLIPYLGRTPKLGRGTYLAPSAILSGDLTAGDDCSFWFHTAARGDVNFIRIGDRTNVQDGSLLHVTHETHPLIIGSRVTIGHASVLHGCTVADDCLIGIGSRVLDGAVIEPFSIVAAGTLVPPGFRLPSGHVAMGLPAKVARPLRKEERDLILDIAERYTELKNRYLSAAGGD